MVFQTSYIFPTRYLVILYVASMAVLFLFWSRCNKYDRLWHLGCSMTVPACRLEFTPGPSLVVMTLELQSMVWNSQQASMFLSLIDFCRIS